MGDELELVESRNLTCRLHCQELVQERLQRVCTIRICLLGSTARHGSCSRLRERLVAAFVTESTRYLSHIDQTIHHQAAKNEQEAVGGKLGDFGFGVVVVLGTAPFQR